jgi:hypothetical protein
MKRATVALFVACVTSIAGALRGQAAGGTLGVQGTMSLNATWARVTGVDFPGSNSGLQSGELRFGGRAAARVGAGLFVGVSVASWQFDYTRFTSGHDVDAVSEGVVVGPYLQFYPTHKLPFFARTGVGYANTWAFIGGGNTIQGFRGNRVSASVGAGADVPLRSHLALTLSLDFTHLIHAENFAEPTSAFIGGVGLTVR